MTRALLGLKIVCPRCRVEIARSFEGDTWYHLAATPPNFATNGTLHVDALMGPVAKTKRDGRPVGLNCPSHGPLVVRGEAWRKALAAGPTPMTGWITIRAVTP